jgi:hypothetical protein
LLSPFNPFDPFFPYFNCSCQPERLVPFRAKTAQIKALTTLIRIERCSQPIEATAAEWARRVNAWPRVMLLVKTSSPFLSVSVAPEGNSRWGLAKATVKADKNGHERTPTEKSKIGRRMLNQPVSSRSAPGSFVPIPSNERMQSAVLHSPIEITNG